MEQILTLYHGSEKIIETPVYGGGREHNDFGTGFYCTENAELAKEWACSSLRDGFANRYILDTSRMNILHLNSESYTILNWIAVLVEHRLFRVRTPNSVRARQYLHDNFYVDVNNFDLITGYRADDSYFDFADAFLNNEITVQQLAQAMELGKLGEQIVLKSRSAFDRIKFEGADPAERVRYYPIRKARNDAAEKAYFEMSSIEADGLYMADIIREKVTNDDKRLPRNISE